MATSDRILDAALASFGTRGYEATSLDAIAAELGVRKQTILYYFPSKEALLEAVIDRSATSCRRRSRTRWSGRARVGSGRGGGALGVPARAPPPGAARPAARGQPARPPPATRLTEALDPLVQRAPSFLEAEMDERDDAAPGRRGSCCSPPTRR